mmetsp:Transcript_872/g.1691  ORF Transcript_872/g.1691 Transcript_872/m.1691 type:complete len:515 (-) Transcript_872:95-1639(-)
MSLSLFLLLFFAAVLHSDERRVVYAHARAWQGEVMSKRGDGLPPAARPAESERRFKSAAIEEVIADMKNKMKDKDLAILFENCFPNTLDTTVYFDEGEREGEEDTFIITGDIPSMWLRDSTNQVWPYLAFVEKDKTLLKMLRGLVRRQTRSVRLDPYANAFNSVDNAHFTDTFKKAARGTSADDQTSSCGYQGSRIPEGRPEVHERKFEIDSLGSFFRLSRGYFLHSGDILPFDHTWIEAVEVVVEVLEKQQLSFEQAQACPPYTFARTTTVPTETLQFETGGPTTFTGMLRSPFRPSDDATTFPLLVPSNAFIAVEAEHVASMVRVLFPEKRELARRLAHLSQTIRKGIDQHARVTPHPSSDPTSAVYAFEVDGYGSHLMMDDANVPSLLSLPYLNYINANDSTYLSTRARLLSHRNPYFAEGSVISGVGSPHTGYGRVWPISVMMQAMTSTSKEEVKACLQTLRSSTSTGLMHESISPSNAGDYTRPWFAWANSLFGETILYIAHTYPDLLF